MEEREAEMLHHLPERSIQVLPVGILDQGVCYSLEASRSLAADLREAGFPGARAGGPSFRLPFPRQPNQAWLYWKRFRALSDSLQALGPDSVELFLHVDVLGATRDDGTLRGVGAVHVYGFTGEGKMAYGRLRNSLHESFKRVDPQSMEDALRLVVGDLLAARQRLGTGGSPEKDPSPSG